MARHLLLFTTIATLFLNAPAFSDGILIPPVGINVSVKYHHVTVTIEDQVAHTEIDQVFINDSDVDSVEGTYIFPLPERASFSSFSMYVDDEELTAEVYDAAEARQIYENIVRRRLDPALLEYIGTGLFQARVYPIRARGEKRIRISYSELIDYDDGVYRYLYPLNTEKFSWQPLQEVSVTVNLKSSVAMKTIYSPSHSVHVVKSDDFNATASYEEENVRPDKDFVLYYTVSPDDIGLNLLTHNTGQEDGFYLFLAAPNFDIDESEVVSKRLLFVLDRSGSMSGEKIVQAKEALSFVVNNLNDSDLFDIVDFSSDIRLFKEEPIEATATSIQSALSYIDGISANGGTNINDALLTALDKMAEDAFTNMIIFLTDGQPTVGQTNNESIDENVRNANRHAARLFVFGVGFNVNTHLLELLSGNNRGIASYVTPGEDIEVAVSSFFNKIKNPVLSGVEVSYGDISVYDLFPTELPDLFKGSQIVQYGRYSNNGSAEIVLSGEVNGQSRHFTHSADFPDQNLENDFIPRLWATRKVGYLLNEIRINGESQELVEEVVALGKRYGIITPYTSFLILEDTPTGNAFESLREQTGANAVADAQSIGNYRDAANPSLVMSEQVRYVDNKTFFMRDSFWVDSEYTGTEMVVDLEFSSDSYFEAVSNEPRLGPAFAIGKNLIVTLDNVAYKVHEPGKNYTGLGSQGITPRDFTLWQNFPNPFNPETVIQYELTKFAYVKLEIHNVAGQKIRTLVDRFRSPGLFTTIWDGRADNGERVPSGVYIYNLRVGSSQKGMKMLVLR